MSQIEVNKEFLPTSELRFLLNNVAGYTGLLNYLTALQNYSEDKFVAEAKGAVYNTDTRPRALHWGGYKTAIDDLIKAIELLKIRG